MEVNVLFFWYLVILGPVLSAWIVLFNRRFAVKTLEFQKRIWRRGYTEANLKSVRVMAVAMGSVMFVFFVPAAG